MKSTLIGLKNRDTVEMNPFKATVSYLHLNAFLTDIVSVCFIIPKKLTSFIQILSKREKER